MRISSRSGAAGSKTRSFTDRVEVVADAFDVELGDGFLAGLADEVIPVLKIVHKQILRQGGGAEGLSQHVESFFEVDVAVGPVGADAPSRALAAALARQVARSSAAVLPLDV